MPRRGWRSAGLLLLVVGLSGAAAQATEPADDEAFDFGDEDEAFDFGDEDEAFDFGDEDAVSTDATSAPKARSDWRSWFTGFVRSDWALWAERFEENPLAKARQSLDLTTGFKWDVLKLDVALHGEYDLAYLHERASYDTATLDVYEWQFNTREVQLAASLGDFEVTVGRQIVAWGEGDMLSPIDVVNPRDMREPGQSDLADIRLPVLATRVGWFTGAHRLELMVVHESDFGYRSPPLGPFSGLEAMVSSGLFGDAAAATMSAFLATKEELTFEHLQPRFAIEQQEVYLRWVYKGAGLDLGAYFASLLDQQGVFSIDLDPVDQTAMTAALASSTFALGLDHQRYHMSGISGAWPYQSLLFKWELSVDIQRPISVEGALLPAVAHAEVINGLVGVTWTGVEHLTLGVELMKPTLVKEPGETLMDMNAPTLSLRVSYKALDDRLTLSTVGLVFGWTAEQGWLVRGDVTYTLVDSLQVGLGYVTYQPGDEPGALFGLDRHDRLFAGVRWDFQVL